MSERKLITISLPPPLLTRAEAVAKKEHRTKSELVREALRFHVDTRGVRRTAMRERAFELIDAIQSRTKGTPVREIRKVVDETVGAARRGGAPRGCMRGGARHERRDIGDVDSWR